jgi:hypothetical protein
MGSPFRSYRGPAVAPLNAYSQQALNDVWNTSYQPVAGLGEANNAMTGLLNGDGYNAGMNQTAGYLNPIAGSADGLNDGLRQTAGQLNQFASGSLQEDPRFQQMLDTNANRAAMQGASMASAKGRYGSGAMGTDMADRIGEANNELMYQNNQAERNRQLQASGMLQGLYGEGMQRKLQASGMLGDLHGPAASRAQAGKLSAAQMLPTLDALKYAGADRRTQVGDFYQNRNQDEHSAQIAQINEEQQLPRQQIEWLSGILNGMGKLGGSQSGTTVDYGKKKSGAEQLAGGLGLLGLFL